MNNQENVQNTDTQQNNAPTKFCKACGGKIAEKAVICPLCGCQVEEIHQAQQPNIVINNSNMNSNVNTNVAMAAGRMKNKWVALLLCFFLGVFGAHRFYEGRIGSGILYIFTVGLFGFGVFFDFLALLFKPNPYYVK